MVFLHLKYTKLIPSIEPRIKLTLNHYHQQPKCLNATSSKRSILSPSFNCSSRNLFGKSNYYLSNQNYLVLKRYSSVNAFSRFVKSFRNQDQKDQKVKLDSDLGIDTDTDDDESDDLFHEPPRVKYGLLKVALCIIFGLYFGAVFAKFGANLLEEYEIFVKGDDEDDDD